MEVVWVEVEASRLGGRAAVQLMWSDGLAVT